MHNLYLIYEILISGFADIILNIFAILAIYFGISVIINNNPVISILYLIGLIASIASYLISEGFCFLGLSYLIIYIGAVSILFLFILKLIDIRLSELQSNTSSSIPLTLIIGIFFCFYLFQFLPYNIAITGGGTNLFGALNFKLFNLLNEDTVTSQAKEFFEQGNLVSASSSSNVITVAEQANLFNTNPLGHPNSKNTLHYIHNEGQASGRGLSISEHITHSVASPKNNNLATASSNA
jgi:NADH-ubiquinone oxidoreductase chain 6